MSERAKLAASAAAWIASERLAQLLSALDEMEHPINQAQKNEILHLAIRSFDGTAHEIEQSLSLEEVLQSIGKPGKAA